MTLKLDLGAGAASPPGFTPMGRDHGSEIWPLRSFADGAVDVIRASHVLEHYPHADVPAVLAEWVRALKPGGELRVAVPDFAKVAEAYLAGVEQPTEAYVMGAQVDENDFHRSVFDCDRLRNLMADAGLVLLSSWTSEIDDCAALPISLNLSGRKPHRAEAKIRAVMTAPRLGFNDMWNSAIQALPRLGIEFIKVGGAFWDQSLTLAIEKALAEPDVEYVLTLDYDSVFTAADVARLIELALVHPEADAVAPIQANRHIETPLFALHGDVGDVDRNRLDVDLLEVATAHFGLTLLRADRLRALPRPWFLGEPNSDGRWADGKVDPDIRFWHEWVAAGNRVFVAPRVVIGHLELMVRWPDQNMRPTWQTTRDWEASRAAPDNAWKGA